MYKFWNNNNRNRHIYIRAYTHTYKYTEKYIYACLPPVWWVKSLEDSEESRLLLMEKMRSGGIGVPETMYLKTRACCSSSCHWEAVKGGLFLAGVGVVFIILLCDDDDSDKREEYYYKSKTSQKQLPSKFKQKTEEKERGLVLYVGADW